MIKFDFRPTNRLVQQVSQLERFAGTWDRLSLSSAIAPEEMASEAIRSGTQSMMLLDYTSPPGLSLSLTKDLENLPLDFGQQQPRALAKQKNHPLFEALLKAHEAPFELELCSILSLYLMITTGRRKDETEGTGGWEAKVRRTSVSFVAPDSMQQFPCVPAFLVDQRLAELVSWTKQELALTQLHPLVVLGIHHLLFLQLSPFPEANHRLSLLMLWHLVKQSYPFVRYSHFCDIFFRRSQQYFNALRQAERSAYHGNWSTAKIWIEFFLDALLCSIEQLVEASRNRTNEAKLTDVQRRIVDAVRNLGSATRDRISSETGINLSTVKYHLTILAAKGHLKREGCGRSTSYVSL